MPYYETSSEQAEQVAREQLEQAQSLQTLVVRSHKLREVRRRLWEELRPLLKPDKVSAARKVLEKIVSEIET